MFWRSVDIPGHCSKVLTVNWFIAGVLIIVRALRKNIIDVDKPSLGKQNYYYYINLHIISSQILSSLDYRI